MASSEELYWRPDPMGMRLAIPVMTAVADAPRHEERADAATQAGAAGKTCSTCADGAISATMNAAMASAVG